MPTPDRRIVLVLGPGRSGTSTMAGTLAMSGFDVPNAIAGKESNPSGFYEPRWVVNFHRDLLRKVDVRTLDADPDAMAITGYDAAMLLFDAIKRAGKAESSAIKDALATTKDFPASTGAMSIDTNRNARKPIVVLEISDGKQLPRESIVPQ